MFQNPYASLMPQIMQSQAYNQQLQTIPQVNNQQNLIRVNGIEGAKAYQMSPNSTAAINANTTEQTQKILDAINTNRMADMQNQINQLQLQSALCGVVRYPNATTYTAGFGPFYNQPCCNNTCNI